MNNFEFPDPYGPGITAVISVIIGVNSLVALPGLVLLFIRRQHRMLRHRNVVSLFLYLGFFYAFMLVEGASMLSGKPPFCEAIDVLTAAAPFFILHNLFLAPMIVIQANKEEVHGLHSAGVIKSPGLLHYAQKFVRPIPRALTSVALGGGLFAASLVVQRFVVLPGDCNQTAIVCFMVASIIQSTLAGVFFGRLWSVRDPFFLRFEIFVTSASHLPATLVLTFVYAFFPQIFPPWFDYRWVFFTMPSAYLNLLFPLLLTEPRFENWLKNRTGRQVISADEEMQAARDFKTNRMILESQEPHRDLLQVVLESPDLLEAFTNFCREEWSQENILFYIAVKNYRIQSLPASPAERLEMAQGIWNTYLGAPDGSSWVNGDQGSVEINIEDTIRKAVQKELQTGEASPELFTKAQHSVYLLMQKDSFVRCCRDHSFRLVVEKFIHNRHMSRPESSLQSRGSDTASELRLSSRYDNQFEMI